MIGCSWTVYVVSSASGLSGPREIFPPRDRGQLAVGAGLIEKAAFKTSSETDRGKAEQELPSVGMSFWPSRTFALTVVGSVFS